MTSAGIGPAIALHDRTRTSPERSGKTNPHARRLTVHQHHWTDRWAIVMTSPTLLGVADRADPASWPAEPSSDAMAVRRQTDSNRGED